MAGDSLKQFNKNLQGTSAGTPANNFNRNHEATQKPMDGWRGNIFDYNYGNYSYTGLGTTTDPMLTSIFGSSNYNTSNNGTTVLETVNTGLTIATGAVGLIAMIGGVIDMFTGKKTKTTSTGSGSELSQLTEQVKNNQGKDIDLLNQLIKVAEATSSEIRANNQLIVSQESIIKSCTEIINTVTENELTPANEEYKEFTQNKELAAGDIQADKANLSSLEAQHNALKDDDPQKATIANQIENLKKQIENKKREYEAKYSKENEDAIRKKIEDATKKIEKAKEDKKEAEEKIKELKEENKKLQKEWNAADAVINQYKPKEDK